MSKRRLRWPLALLAVLAVCPIVAADLPVATDLAGDAQRSKRELVPILVFFSADYCPYCEPVNELHLTPLFESRQYVRDIMFRVVDVDGSTSVRDFNGQHTDHKSFAESEGVSLTPVIRLYGHDGKELVPELLGYSSADFYGAYLERAIVTAIAGQRGSKARDSTAIPRDRVLQTEAN